MAAEFTTFGVPVIVNSLYELHRVGTLQLFCIPQNPTFWFNPLFYHIRDGRPEGLSLIRSDPDQKPVR